MTSLSFSYIYIDMLYTCLYIYKYIYISIYLLYPLICLSIYLFIHLPVHGHLGCFNTLAIVNNAAMNTAVRVSFQISVSVFFRNKPRIGTAESYVSSIFSFLRNCSPQQLYQFTSPPTV